ncbi:hypothetical protein [Haliangium sp.]|uniref:hypothetical protein n=1 Tax=Haliangium sp. TaxID=2663208 RepID=UPI003D100F16
MKKATKATKAAPKAAKAAKKKSKTAAAKAAKKTAKAPNEITKKAAPKKGAKAAKRPSGKKAASSRSGARGRRVPGYGEAALFEPLTSGERAEALRVLTEDQRLATMASVGRYRVITAEPQVVKPPHELAAHRLARVVIYDYAAERSVDACVDLDTGTITYLNLTRSQPMLAPEEEAAAIAIALADDRVKSKLSLGDEAQVAMHYWSPQGTSLAYTRRSAAVLFGQSSSAPAFVAVVDLLDNLVCELVPAAEW